MSLHESDVGQDEWYQISKKIWRMWLRFKNTLWIISPGASSSSPGSLLAPPSSLVFINFLVKKKQQQNSPPSILSFDLLLISNSTRISIVQTIPSGKFYWRLSLCGYCGVKVSCSVGGLIVTDSGSDTHRLYSLLQPAACHICYTLAFYM